MKIRTQLKAGRINMRGESLNHNEALQVRSAVKAGGIDLGNHNEALQVRSTLKAGRAGWSNNHNETLQVRSSLKAGGTSYQHNETLQTRTGLKAGRLGLRGTVQTTARKKDRLELLVVRAGLKAGRARIGRWGRYQQLGPLSSSTTAAGPTAGSRPQADIPRSRQIHSVLTRSNILGPNRHFGSVQLSDRIALSPIG
jgi:hypothetical protein